LSASSTGSSAAGTLLRPFFIVDCIEKGGVLRFGKYHRSGARLPLEDPLIEKVLEVTAVETTWHSPAQPLTTKDDVAVTVTTVVRYEVTDPKAYITTIFDQKDVLADRTMGAVRRLVAKKTYRELVDAEEPEKEIATLVKRAVHKYGFLVTRSRSPPSRRRGR
jgi:regulator of protease activity HflC (stomatin/prohibitin superfamily)